MANLPTTEDLLPAIRRVVRRIAEGSVSPSEGMRALIDVVVGRDVLHRESGSVLGDAWGLERMVGAYYQYADIDEQPELGWGPDALRGDEARAHLDRQIVSDAVDWLQSHSA